LDAKQTVLLTHGDSVETVAPNFAIAAKCAATGVISAIAGKDKPYYGLQFHPEVDLTLESKKIMANFLSGVAGFALGAFSLAGRRDNCLEYIKDTVGDRKVLMLLSGGVDSTVAATIMRQALRPEQIIAIHIDNGFMRKGESEQVAASLERLGLSVRVERAAKEFLNGHTTVKVLAEKNVWTSKKTDLLCFVADPEEKRKIIGDVFMDVRQRVLADMGLDPADVLLGQGTLRPDLIESASSLASSSADVIKTHHNDTDLVRKLRAEGKVVEPLVDFHKDEVRALGRQLGLPPEFVERHPFPGPGLAIRIICQSEPYVEKDFAETQVLSRLVVDYNEMVERDHALLNRIESACSELERRRLREVTLDRKYGATLLPIRTVGVQGDGRSYSYAVGITCLDVSILHTYGQR